MKETSMSLIDIGKLSEPASKLIDAVADAIGVVYEPTRIRRKAKADADAAITLAKSHQEIKAIERRAAERLRSREVRRQHNIEAITQKALVELPASVSKQPVDEDWIFDFFGQCQDVSNEQMRLIWARVLAGEVARPGTFSLRTLATVKMLNPTEAELFGRYCSFVWQIEGKPEPIIISRKDEPIVASGINFDSLLHLDSLGLVRFNSAETFHLNFDDEPAADYFGRKHLLIMPDQVRTIAVGDSVLTAIGSELVSISGAQPNEEYRNLVVQHWRKQGIKVDEQ